jgi:hypothetical protein
MDKGDTTSCPVFPLNIFDSSISETKNAAFFEIKRESQLLSLTWSLSTHCSLARIFNYILATSPLLPSKTFHIPPCS